MRIFNRSLLPLVSHPPRIRGSVPSASRCIARYRRQLRCLSTLSSHRMQGGDWRFRAEIMASRSSGQQAQGRGQPALQLENRLSESRSPYVRGHMHNPVAWQIWGPEAVGLAKKHNRMIFLSIGYSACHWCHVMERESFMSPEIASILNGAFIPIKLDREERPDVDDVYMNYVQATTGSGGWPLNVFLTPDLEPVFGGTYWPGPNSTSLPRLSAEEHVGFLDILEKMRDVWQTQQQRCLQSAKEITRQLKEFAEEGTHSSPNGKTDDEDLEVELLEDAYKHFVSRYDSVNGGFSTSPKFPTPANLSFLLRLSQFPEPVRDVIGQDECDHAAAMVVFTLRKMARGGIRDHIGYGFARYSVTQDWSLPHFEKMLYDQAQLLDVYLDAFKATHDPELLGAVYDISTYLTSAPMSAESGGIFSSEDADSLPHKGESEKREGAFYVWTLKELQQVLGEKDASVCAKHWGVRTDGNVAPQNDPHDELMNQNVLSIKSTPSLLAKEFGLTEEDVVKTLKSARLKLREYRVRERPRPDLDDKIVVSWNGLTIGALARSALVLEDIDPGKSNECKTAAVRAAAFIKESLYDAHSGQLWRVYREGRGDTPAFADDYAFLTHGLINLYEATFDDCYLQFADTLQKYLIQHFHDPKGGFFGTTATPLPPAPLLRLKSGTDAAEPSTNGIIAQNLFRLSSLLENDEYLGFAKSTCNAFAVEIIQHPFLFVSLLSAVVMKDAGMKGVIVTGESEAVERAVKMQRGKAGPTTTITRLGGAAKGEWLRGKNGLLRDLDGEKARVLVCEGGVCKDEGSAVE